MLKRFAVVLASLFAPLLATAAAAAAPLTAGIDYAEVSPQPTDSPGKVEVVEFFWYGCPHCYDLEPALEAWVKKLPKDVVFKRVPAAFNEQWAIAGRVYYTLDAVGEVERLHRALFDAIHRDHLRITSDSEMADWLKKQHVDVAKYAAAYKSFAVDSRLKRAVVLLQDYRVNGAPAIDGVPAIVVQGRYLVNGSMAGSHQQMLATSDYLIGLARKNLHR